MNRKLLIVDDDEDLLQFMSFYLKENKFITCEASNGKEALKALKEFEPELVILDVSMPIMDGFETCSQIRQDPQLDHLPIIFLTGNQNDKDLLTGYSKGCDSYFIKPTDFDKKFLAKILNEINKLLDRDPLKN